LEEVASTISEYYPLVQSSKWQQVGHTGKKKDEAVYLLFFIQDYDDKQVLQRSHSSIMIIAE
jgi:hypothetical protein